MSLRKHEYNLMNRDPIKVSELQNVIDEMWSNEIAELRALGKPHQSPFRIDVKRRDAGEAWLAEAAKAPLCTGPTKTSDGPPSMGAASTAITGFRPTGFETSGAKGPAGEAGPSMHAAPGQEEGGRVGDYRSPSYATRRPLCLGMSNRRRPCNALRQITVPGASHDHQKTPAPAFIAAHGTPSPDPVGDRNPA